MHFLKEKTNNITHYLSDLIFTPPKKPKSPIDSYRSASTEMCPVGYLFASTVYLVLSEQRVRKKLPLGESEMTFALTCAQH